MNARYSKVISLMLALIMLLSTLGTTPVFAVSEYYSKLEATDATVTLDGTNPGTVTVSLAGTANMDVYGIQGDWDTKDSTGKLTLTEITTDISNVVFTDMSYADAATGKVLWSDDTFSAPAKVANGTNLLNATYTVAADTPSGTYTVRFKFITLTATDNNSYTDEVYYTATVTVVNGSGVTVTCVGTITYTVSGQVVTVKHSVACKVGYLVAGTYKAIPAVANPDGSYSFTAPADVSAVLLVVKGDSNGNGGIQNSDVTRTKAAYFGKITLSPESAFAADVNGDGSIANSDVTRTKAVFLGKTSMSW